MLGVTNASSGRVLARASRTSRLVSSRLAASLRTAHLDALGSARRLSVDVARSSERAVRASQLIASASNGNAQRNARDIRRVLR